MREDTANEAVILRVVNLCDALQKLLHLCFVTVEVNSVSVQPIAELHETLSQSLPINIGTCSLLMPLEGDVVDDEDQPVWILVHLVWCKASRKLSLATRKEGSDV